MLKKKQKFKSKHAEKIFIENVIDERVLILLHKEPYIHL